MHTDAYRIVQHGAIVARVEGPNSLRDIILRAGQYREEGPLAIQKRAGKRWRAYGLMEVGNG